MGTPAVRSLRSREHYGNPTDPCEPQVAHGSGTVISDPSVVWLIVGAFTVVLGFLFVRSKGRDLLVYVMAFYLYFAFGPIINRLLGLDIYRGILEEQIGPAVAIMTLALCGMLTVAVLVPPRFPSTGHDFTAGRKYPLLTLFIVALSAYALTMLVLVGPSTMGLDKHGVIATIGPQLHYSYLTLQFYAVAAYLLVDRQSATHVAYWANVLLFVGYCMMTGERDFIFAVGAVIVGRFAAGRSRISARHVILAAGAVWIATTMFAQRMSDTTVDLGVVLNQGSILFIDSSVASLVPDYVPFMGGWSYLNSAFALLPSFIYDNQFYLLDWFVQQFAPGSRSGYGFSLSAEAYLNFGYLGVPIVFASIALIHRWVTNRMDRHPILAAVAVLYTGWLLYAFRGDSLQLFKGVAYGIVVLGAVYVLSQAKPLPRDGTARSSGSSGKVHSADRERLAITHRSST